MPISLIFAPKRKIKTSVSASVIPRSSIYIQGTRDVKKEATRKISYLYIFRVRNSYFVIISPG